MLKLEDIYDVNIAKDGQEAYEMVKASMENGQYFNLIFMDIQVSGRKRLECHQLILADAQCRRHTKYAPHSTDGVFCANRGTHSFLRGK